MSIRIGANPIGWTNDDLQEIGGDTPLETCLAQAKEAGVVGVEKGHKLPSDGAALKDKLAELSSWPRLRTPSTATAQSLCPSARVCTKATGPDMAPR
jgi:hypothetical protein